MSSDLIIMLTHNDKTVSNANSILESCSSLNVKYWGMKSDPLPIEEMKKFSQRVHELNKTSVLEAVCYTESEGLEAAQKAVYCNFDIFMGTCYSSKINDFCKKHNLKYMPFIGKPSLTPSILEGSPDELIEHARSYAANGVYGIDYLAYRHINDCEKIMKQVLAEIPEIKCCIAGSVNSFEKIQAVKDCGAAYFTIGSAFFENMFGENFPEQIQKVLNFIEK